MLDHLDPPRRARVQPRLAEAIAAELRERILNGAYGEGMLPKQEELIAEFGVSGPPVREALRILEVDGLITVRRGKVGGAVVHRPDGGAVSHALGMTLQGERVSLRDVAESVLQLEPMCAAGCARMPDRATLLRPVLEANIAETEKAIGDGPAFTHRSRLFHDLIVAHVPQVTIRLVVRSVLAVWTAQEETWAHEVAEAGRYPNRREQRAVLDAHKRIAEMIFKGDADEAERLARAHTRGVQKRVIAEFGNRTVDASSARAVRGLREVTARHSDLQLRQQA
ncbi:FadR family transcriptional regulator [Amycolatopsis sp. K13G38]|uniref:FadR family transcriptional regulator n=1 Tax=Amycolatopsis acididurans TaxID=2724524 RepID=A0ABX1JAK0_9PSEU|nr:GntR family transcriptional regulator [Amycolatopsis acididurans]NKQ56714.1 FadR family transcriptional regulator [Amycolatopsis acididurans]